MRRTALTGWLPALCLASIPALIGACRSAPPNPTVPESPVAPAPLVESSHTSEAVPGATPAAASIFREVVVLGASLSGGFGLQGELQTDFDLSRSLELAVPGIEVQSLGNNFFFSDPGVLGAGQVRRAAELDASLVIALDFCFWYVYAPGDPCERRRRGLERCFALLDEIEAPLLLGDLLDATPALAGSSAFTGGRPVIRPWQIPDSDCLDELNERLYAWAAERENVHIFPIAAFFDDLDSPETLALRGNVYDEARKGTLMQRDLLHPNYRGLAAATLGALDGLASAGVIDSSSVQWDATQLEAAIWSTTEEERTTRRRKQLEREERRAERAAQRAESARDEVTRDESGGGQEER